MGLSTPARGQSLAPLVEEPAGEIPPWLIVKGTASARGGAGLDLVALSSLIPAPGLDSVEKQVERGDYAGAWRQLALAPAGAQSAALRARLLLIHGDVHGAVGQARLAVELGSSQSSASRMLLAKALVAYGQPEEAKVVLRQVMRGADASSPGQVLGSKLLMADLLQSEGKLAAARRLRKGVVLDQRRLLPLESCDSAAPAVRAVCLAQVLRSIAPKERALILRHSGSAQAALGELEGANRYFAFSMAFAAEVQTLVVWAEALLGGRLYDRAQRLLDLAVTRNPLHPDVLALQAQLALVRQVGVTDGLRYARKALTVNPQHMGALLALAELELYNGAVDSAERVLRRARVVAPDSLAVLTLQVAARYVAEDAEGQSLAEQVVLHQQPDYAPLYLRLAQVADRRQHYRAALTFAEQAIALAPKSVDAYVLAGMNLLRLGQEAQARARFASALQVDPVEPVARRVLTLYRTVIDPLYVSWQEGLFNLRTSKAQQAVLAPYLGPLLRRGFDEMTQRYGEAPPAPLRLELYDTERDFGIRVTGYPYAGVQGVCFGASIVTISPAAAEFNWGQIIWHELSHVFHLHLSQRRVPRWFTEGLAEYETGLGRPEWQRKPGRPLWEAQRRGMVPPLDGLELAFRGARNGEELIVAYYTATLAVRYVVDTYGFPRAVRMLKAWGRGLDTEAVYREVLGISADALQRGFDTYLAQRFAAFEQEFRVTPVPLAELPRLQRLHKQHPRDAALAARLALGLVTAQRYEQAEKLARAALALDPKQPVALFAMGRVAIEHGDRDSAEASIAGIVAAGYDSPLLRRLLAHAAHGAGRLVEAEQQVRLAIAQDPLDVDNHRLLLELALEEDRVQVAIEALSAITTLDQHDRQSYGLLLQLLEEQGTDTPEKAERLVQVGEAALYADPAAPLVHQTLADGYLALGRYHEALREYEQLQRHSTADAGVALAHFGRARVLLLLNRPEEARQAMAQALTLKPELVQWFDHQPATRPRAGSTKALDWMSR